MRSSVGVLAAGIVAVGVALGGWFVGRGFLESRAPERFVTVKGVAEQLVKADLALWPMRFVATSNRLSEAQEQIVADTRKVFAFITTNGVPPDAVEVDSLQVNDLLAQAYRSGPIESRFIVTQTLIVRTGEVDKVVQASQKIGDLVSAGVVLSNEGQSSSGPIYLFTRLNDIKPGMIAEATKGARQAAEQFANDSGSRLAGIRRANQGLFQIQPRDETPGAAQENQVMKTVRVVSTIDYALAE